MNLAEQDPENLADQGEAHRLEGRLEEAVECFSRAVELAPDNAYVPWHRALVKESLGRYGDALTDLDLFVAHVPDDPEGYWKRGQIHRRLGQMEQALADLTRVVLADPAHTWALLERARVYDDLDREAEALAELDRAIALDPESGWARGLRGRALYYLDREEEALAELDKAIARGRDDAKLILLRGTALKDLGRYREALTDVERAVALDPTARAYAERGDVLIFLNWNEDALADLDRSVELDPDDGFARENRGILYSGLGRDEDACAELTTAIALGYDFPLTRLVRGRSLLNLSRREEAIADFDRAIELDPGHVRALVARGLAYVELHRYEEALADLDRATELDPGHEEAAELRDHLFLLLLSPAESFSLFAHYLVMGTWELAGDNPEEFVEALDGWANLWRIAGDEEIRAKELRTLDRTIAEDPGDVVALASRALQHRAAGRYQAVLTDLDRVLAVEPDNRWALGLRRAAQFDGGRPDEDDDDFDWAYRLYHLGLPASLEVMCAIALADGPDHLTDVMRADLRRRERRIAAGSAGAAAGLLELAGEYALVGPDEDMERLHARARGEPDYDTAKAARIAATKDLLDKSDGAGEELPQFRRLRHLLALLQQ
ncbi:tetratricopeptide repeat protein [Nonomuraea fuscirosea]|uniref:tetratricopeptide repeat protein n=1 Tax=Nonomuraea fuscirosea TaxID=1291556 RepID=UPI003721509C